MGACCLGLDPNLQPHADMDSSTPAQAQRFGTCPMCSCMVDLRAACTVARPAHAVHAQAVDMAELMEAVGRTRFGVNGGGGSVLGQGLQRRLWDWVVENLSSSRTVRSLPVSGS